jgi:phage gp37-like protein
VVTVPLSVAVMVLLAEVCAKAAIWVAWAGGMAARPTRAVAARRVRVILAFLVVCRVVSVIGSRNAPLQRNARQSLRVCV